MRLTEAKSQDSRCEKIILRLQIETNGFYSSRQPQEPQHSQEQCRHGGWCQGQGPGHQGRGVPRHRQAHFRWAEEEGSSQDQARTHRQPPQASRWQEGHPAPAQARLRGQEGHLQAVQEGLQARRQRLRCRSRGEIRPVNLLLGNFNKVI